MTDVCVEGKTIKLNFYCSQKSTPQPYHNNSQFDQVILVSCQLVSNPVDSDIWDFSGCMCDVWCVMCDIEVSPGFNVTHLALTVM